MCLDKLTAGVRPCRVGYKRFRVNQEGELAGDWMATGPLPVGKWLNERDYRQKGGCLSINELRTFATREQYPRGWHIYHSKRNLTHHTGYQVRKVEVREPLCTGVENIAILAPFFEWVRNKKATVARYIKISGKPCELAAAPK